MVYSLQVNSSYIALNNSLLKPVNDFDFFQQKTTTAVQNQNISARKVKVKTVQTIKSENK